MTAQAVVISARPDGCVDLEFEPLAACAGCAGTCLWKRIGTSRLERMPVARPFEAGARVTVGLPARRLLAISLLLHGVPLAAILVGAAAGALAGESDLATLTGVVVAVAVVAICFGSVRRRLERATLAGLVVTPRS
jgi:positive regulator of sigma E activity